MQKYCTFCTIEFFLFSINFNLSKRSSDGDRSLFTLDSRREVNAIYCKHYLSKWTHNGESLCILNKPFVLVKKTTFLNLDSDAKNTKRQIKYAVFRMYLKIMK